MDHQDQLPPNTRIRILESQKTGHAVPCLGLARALGVEPDITPVRPGKLFHLIAPWGPANPAFFSIPRRTAEIVIASGKETVPVLRKVKQISPDTFTIYLGDPRASRHVFDLIWTPMHDRIIGANIFKTLTSPHPHNAATLQAAREQGDTRLTGLASPRVAVLIGGPSGQYAFGEQDISAICTSITALLEQNASVMISPSRRTPEQVMEKVTGIVSACPGRSFVWDGTGDNPYQAMLAHADAFLVTADSVNMIGEALATGKPVHVLQLDGKTGKFKTYYDELESRGLIRFWSGQLQEWSYPPLDATAQIAAETIKRYRQFRTSR